MGTSELGAVGKQAGVRWLGRRSVRKRLSNILMFVIAIAGSWLFIGPLLWTIATSLKPLHQIVSQPYSLIPDPPTWRNYADALGTVPFARYTLNTLFLVAVNIVGGVGSSALIAYGFSRFRFPGRDFLFMVLLATMMLPGVVTMIPLYVWFSKLHWINTYLPLTVTAFFGNPWLIFLLRQFFMTLPLDLDDAARIDGANFIQIFLRIMVPLSKPALVTVSIFIFMGVWNDFFGPLIYLTNDNMSTIALGLFQLKNALVQQYLVRWDWMMAGSLVFMVPTLVIFFLAQNVFMEGVTLIGVQR